MPSIRLLVVDDEAPHVRALCGSLNTHGYTTTGYTTAEEALAAIQTGGRFDLMLSDLVLPGDMDGIALLRACQEIDPNLGGVIMTAHGTIDSAVTAMKQGALDYIQKPFEMRELIPMLERALVARDLRKENESLHQRLHARTLELEASNKELESFSYSVSHDLRAPLRAIGSFTDLLLEELTDANGPQIRTYAETVRANAHRMNALIEDLLRLALTTRAEVNLAQVNLSTLASDIVRGLERELSGRTVGWIIAPGIIAECDPGLLRVVMENLLSNAWKYTARTENARIEFGSEMQPGGTVAYFVRDNGAGFDMKYADRLFAPFQRLHAERDFPGTGVGLATVQRIIKKHGGRIWPKAAPGQGATFYFTLTSGGAK
jgi:signal transduction histidine kinase